MNVADLTHGTIVEKKWFPDGTTEYQSLSSFETTRVLKKEYPACGRIRVSRTFLWVIKVYNDFKVKKEVFDKLEIGDHFRQTKDAEVLPFHTYETYLSHLDID